MRVIAGSKKGIALRGGHGPFFRPTAQVVKGSIFETLGDAVEGATFLDLFAGSGAIGIEALSRGAARAVFVEQDHAILRALRANLDRCGFGRAIADVKLGDAMRYIERLGRSDETFDIIFADPPYTGHVAQRVVAAVEAAERQICRWLVVEHGEPLFNKDVGPLEKTRTRKFGQTSISYYRWRKEGAEREGNEGALPGDV